MATFDPKLNLAIGRVLTKPSPAISGTTLVLKSGEGSRFPQPSTDGAFNITIFPNGVLPTPANAEIARVTARTTDTLTITRATESSTARTIQVGDIVVLGITKKSLVDIENYLTGTTGWPADLLPDTDDTWDLGSASKEWADLFVQYITLSVGVKSHLLPATTSIYDLGSALKKWKDLFLSGDATVTGAITSKTDTLVKPFVVVGFGGAVDYLCDGTADDVQIQAALDAAYTAGGGIVFVKAGTYDLIAQLTIDNNVTLVGEGMGLTIFKVSVAMASMIISDDLTNGTDNVVIKDIYFNGNGLAATNTDGGCNGSPGGIKLAGSNNVVERCRVGGQKVPTIVNGAFAILFFTITGSQTPTGNIARGNLVEDYSKGIAIWSDDGWANQILDTLVQGNICRDLLGQGIWSANASRLIIDGNIVWDCASGIWLSYNTIYSKISNNIIYATDDISTVSVYVGHDLSHDCSVTDNIILNGSGVGIALKGNRQVISGNVIYNCAARGIDIGNAMAANMNDILVNDNNINLCGSNGNREGIYIFDSGAYTVNRLTISNNIISNSYGYGIRDENILGTDRIITGNIISDSGSYGVLVKADETTITNNIIKNSGVVGLALYTTDGGCIIVGNRIYDDGVGNQDYGIDNHNGDVQIVTNNDLRNNVVAATVGLTTCEIGHNLGY